MCRAVGFRVVGVKRTNTANTHLIIILKIEKNMISR